MKWKTEELVIYSAAIVFFAAWGAASGYLFDDLDTRGKMLAYVIMAAFSIVVLTRWYVEKKRFERGLRKRVFHNAVIKKAIILDNGVEPLRIIDGPATCVLCFL
ncbi:MAG: hypothetical protein ACOX8X_02335 [Methanomethylophilus sp.]|jgi:phage-related holin